MRCCSSQAMIGYVRDSCFTLESACCAALPGCICVGNCLQHRPRAMRALCWSSLRCSPSRSPGKEPATFKAYTKIHPVYSLPDSQAPLSTHASYKTCAALMASGLDHSNPALCHRALVCMVDLGKVNRGVKVGWQGPHGLCSRMHYLLSTISYGSNVCRP